jgi:hypothetical protein
MSFLYPSINLRMSVVSLPTSRGERSVRLYEKAASLVSRVATLVHCNGANN